MTWVEKATQPSQARQLLIVRVSVARVQPKSSKGITDLLLPQASPRWTHGVLVRGPWCNAFVARGN